MRKLILLLMFSLTAVTGFAQFTLDRGQTEQYLKEKADQAEARRVQDSIRQEKLEEERLMASDVRYKLKWGNMLTYRQAIGFMEGTYNLSYYGYFITKEVWTYPINLRISSSKSYNESNMNAGYTDWSEHLTYLGISAFRNLKNDFYVSIGGHLPLGWELYRKIDDDADKRRFHFLVGLNAEERIMYMSPNNVGLVLGFGFYQRLMNSRLYTLDAGFSLEVGVKF